jgi:PAS domain S-box-containing protein
VTAHPDAAELTRRAVRASMDGLSGIAVFVLDPDGRVLDCYGGALARHGYQPAAMVGNRLGDLVPAAVWEHTAPLIAHALAGDPSVIERVSYDRTSEYEVTATPLKEDGQIVGVTLCTREISDLRATQRELAETARRFQALAETSVEGHCRYGADGSLLWASPSMRRVLGRSVDDDIGTRTQQVVHPDDSSIRDGAVAAMLSSRQPQTVEYRAEHGDGTWHWFESTVRGWFDEHDRLLEVHVTTRDVTARRADDELRRQWQLSFDATSRGIMLTDPHTDVIQRVNTAFAIDHGGTPEDFAGKPLVEVFSPAARSRIAEFAAFVNREGYLRYETEHMRLDGTVFPVDTEVVAARGPDGRLLYRVAYVSDLTEQKAREASEHHAVTLFATALDKAPIGMCLIGLDGRFLRVNEALCRLAGRTEDEMLACTFRELTHPDDLDLDLTLYHECLRAQRAGYEIDKRYLRADGEVIQARLSVSLVRDGVGKPMHFICQIVDLTERTRLEEQLEASIRIARDLLSDLDAHSLQHIAREAAQIARADRVLVLLPTRDPDHLQVAVAVGSDVGHLPGTYVAMEGTITGQVFRTGELQVLDETVATAAAAAEVHFAPTGGLGPSMMIPLLGEREPRGALALGRDAGRPPFAPADVELAKAFAQQAAIALELADARELARQVELLEDRDRIARDLHDHVIQRLFAAGLTMQSMAGSLEPAQAERLMRCIEDIDETITQIRSAIYGLRAPLTSALSSTRERILSVLADVTPLLSSAPVVQFAGPLDVMLPDDLVDDLIAVLRETLTNVARHARAGSVRVAIEADIERRELSVQVADDGVGMGETARRSGLANLRKRAESRSGTFLVESPEAGGTRVGWVVPIP